MCRKLAVYATLRQVRKNPKVMGYFRRDVLASYQIDPERGFLPAQDPLTHLPAPFAEWDRLAAIWALILTGRVRDTLERLSTPDLACLEDSRQLERAMLIISAFGMAYVWGMEPPATHLPG